MNSSTVSSSAAHEIAELKIVALYQPDSGKVMHVHVVTMFKGGRSVSEQEAVDAAYKHAARLGHVVTELKSKVSSDHLHASRPHWVDPRTSEFVPLPLPRMKARRFDM
jgi:hypothetical protein